MSTLTTPSLAPHPGDILKAELSEHKLSQRELATAMGKSAPMINGILNGTKAVSVEIAILLEAALPGGMKASQWLTLQNEYDIQSKRKEDEIIQKTSAMAVWNFLRGNANYNSIRKRMDFGSDLVANVSKVMDAFGIQTLDELKLKLAEPNRGFKKSEKVQTDSANLFSWVLIVRNASNNTPLSASFSLESIPDLKKELNAVFFRNTNVVERTTEILNRYGIKHISDEKRLDKVPVDGYSFWIGDNPTIVTTQRMNRIDNFAFTVMHELGHIQLHLSDNRDVDFIELDKAIMHINKQEDEANEYATRALWNEESPNRIFAQIDNPYAAESAIRSIARQFHMNTGIVAGQYRHYCNRHHTVANAYTLCHGLIEHIN